MPNESENFDYNLQDIQLGKQHTWFLRRVGRVEALPDALGMTVKDKETQKQSRLELKISEHGAATSAKVLFCTGSE